MIKATPLFLALISLSSQDPPQPTLQFQGSTTATNTRAASGLDLSRDDRLLIINDTLWDATTGRKLRDFQIESPHSYKIRFHPNKTHAYTAAGEDFYYEWSLATGLITRKFQIKAFFNAAPLKNNRLLTISFGKGAISNLNSSTVVTNFEVNPYSSDIIISPDQNTFIVDYQVGIQLVFSFDEAYVSAKKNEAQSLKTTPQLFNVSNLSQPLTLSGHSKPVTSYHFSDDGNFLVTASQDGSIRQWSTKSGKKSKEFLSSSPKLFARHLSNGNILATSDKAVQQLNSSQQTEIALSYQIWPEAATSTGSNLYYSSNELVGKVAVVPGTPFTYIQSQASRPFRSNLNKTFLTVDFEKSISQYRLHIPLLNHLNPYTLPINEYSFSMSKPSFSTDGTILCVIPNSDTINLVSTETGLPLCKIEEPNSLSFSDAWLSEDANYVFARNAVGLFSLWRLQKQKVSLVKVLDVGLTAYYDFDPVGLTFAYMRRDGVAVHHLLLDDPPKVIKTPMSDFAISPGGSMLATVGYDPNPPDYSQIHQVIFVFDTVTGSELSKTPLPSALYDQVTWGVKGETLLVRQSLPDRPYSEGATLACFNIGESQPQWTHKCKRAGKGFTVNSSGTVLAHNDDTTKSPIVSSHTLLNAKNGKVIATVSLPSAPDATLAGSRGFAIYERGRVDLHDKMGRFVTSISTSELRGFYENSTKTAFIQPSSQAELHLIDIATQKEAAVFPPMINERFTANSMAGNYLASPSASGYQVQLLNLETMVAKQIVMPTVNISGEYARDHNHSPLLSRDGKVLIANHYGDPPTMWSAESGHLIAVAEKPRNFDSFSYLKFANNEQLLCGLGQTGIYVWQTQTGKFLKLIPISSDEFSDFHTDQNYIYTRKRRIDLLGKEPDSKLNLGDGLVSRTTDELLAILPNKMALVGRYLFLLPGRYVQDSLELCSLPDLKPIAKLPVNNPDKALAGCSISQDGSRAVLNDGTHAHVYSLQTKEVIARIPATRAIITPSGKSLITHEPFSDSSLGLSKQASRPKIRNRTTGETLVEIKVDGPEFLNPTWLPDDRTVLGSGNGKIYLVSADTGLPILTIADPERNFGSAFLLATNRIAAPADDSTIVIFDFKGKQVAKVLSFAGTLQNNNRVTWAVVDQSGRFDVSHFDDESPLHWVMPDEPFTAYPLETYARDYFEPNLLGKILREEPIRPVANVAKLCRTSPEISLDAKYALGFAIINVTVKPGKPRTASQKPGIPQDLKITINGKTVASVSGPLPLNDQGEYEQLFEVPLPQTAYHPKFKIGAYCFNQDRVKTSTLTQTIETTIQSTQGSCQIVSIGVNQCDIPGLNLKYAKNDAELFAQVIGDMVGGYRSPSKHILISDEHTNNATKEFIQETVLRLSPNQMTPATLPILASVMQSYPEDILFLNYSGHGTTDSNGLFYLIPSNAKRDSFGNLDLRSCISTTELSEWLQNTRFQEMIIVIDACHSAAVVGNQGFQPGPFGNADLGQLAYEKGIRILSGSQSQDKAFENSNLKHGILSYALLVEGLEQNRAGRPDRPPTIRMLMDYAIQRVPQIHQQLKAGSFTTTGTKDMSNDQLSPRETQQQPSRFDFLPTDLDCFKLVRNP